MAKNRPEITDRPKPPESEIAAEQPSVCGLDGWSPSEDPQVGHFADHNDGCGPQDLNQE